MLAEAALPFFSAYADVSRPDGLDITSAGIGSSSNEALLKAIAEAYERYATGLLRVERSDAARDLTKQGESWREQRRNFHVLDLSSLGVTVAMVIMVSGTYSCFAGGAAASTDSFEDAAVKAFRETELHLASLTMMPERSPIAPEQVRNILDHAQLYLWPVFGHLTWLWSGKEVQTIPVPSATTEELHEELNTIVVKLSPENSPLKVMRTLSPKLIPLSFGYGLTYRTHPAVGCLSPGSLNMPHYFT